MRNVKQAAAPRTAAHREGSRKCTATTKRDAPKRAADIGTEHGGNARQQNITYCSAAYARDDAHENRHKRIDLIGEGFGSAGNGKEGQAASVESD
jgi:hypothetical protein